MKLFIKKIIPICLSVFIILGLSACQSLISVPGEKQQPITEDIAEKAPGSLKIDVEDFSWSYISNNSHIRITGVAVNNSSQVYQGVLLSVTAHDEKGNPILRGSSYLVPTYLKPGAKADFDLVGITKRRDGVKNLRLITSAKVTR